MGADVVICLSTGQDGNFHMTWLCVLGLGLAMVVLSSSSVLVSVMCPTQQAYNTVINQISCSSKYWLIQYFILKNHPLLYSLVGEVLLGRQPKAGFHRP